MIKIVRASSLQFIPASHEDPKNPGSLKKVLFKRDELLNGSISMINWALLPIGKSFKAHYHEDMEEIFIILSGEAEITINHETETLKKGDAVLIPPRATHRMTNNSTEDVHYIALGISKEGKGKTIVVE